MAAPGSRKDVVLYPVWGVLAVVVLGAPLAVGGVLPAVQAGLALLAGLMLVLLSRARHGQRRRVAPGALVWLPVAGSAWSLFQCVPLPIGLLRVLSPHSAALWETMAQQGEARFGSISGEPLATLTTAAALWTFAATLAVCLDLARSTPHRIRLLQLVVGASTAVLVVGAAQTALGLQGPLGLFPMKTVAAFNSTFINPNHTAALLMLGIFGCLGVAMASQTRDAQVMLGGLALACAVAMFLCGSNGALMGLAVGLAVTTLLSWRAVRAAKDAGPSDETPRRGSRTMALVALGLSVPLALLATRGPDLLGLKERAAMAWETKRETITEGFGAISDYWLTGLGRGAFEAVFPRHKVSVRPYTFVSPENLEVLWLVEWGVPVGLGLLAGWLWILGAWVLRGRSVVGAAAAGGAVALWLHNQADFNLELLGVALPFAAMLGAARVVPNQNPLSDEERRAAAKKTTRQALWAGVCVMLLGWFPAFWSMTHAVTASREHALKLPVPERAAALHQHLMDHPTDYLAALTLSRLYRAAEPPDLAASLRWVNRAMFLNPTHHETAMDAGRVLWALGQREQATLQWGAALRLPTVYGNPRLNAELVSRGLTVEELWTVFGDGSRLEVCGILDSMARAGDAERCLQRLATLTPDDVRVRVRLGERALALGDLDEAMRQAQASSVLDANHAAVALLQARILYAQGREEEGDRALDRARAARSDAVELDRVRFDRAMAAGDLVRAREVLAQLGQSVQARGLPMAEVMIREAALEERAGNVVQAMVHFRNAARSNPADPAGALGAARMSVALGHPDLGISILREASMANPHPAYTQQLNVMEGRVRALPRAATP